MEAVLELLKTLYNWLVCASAYPDQKGVEEALAAGMTPMDIAAKLNARAERQPASPDTWAQKLWLSFGGGNHYRLLTTRQALGLANPDPVHVGRKPARTAEDLVEATLLGWHYTGEDMFLDLSTEQGRATFEARAEHAKYMPLSWHGVAPLVYWWLVMTGRVETRVPDFGSRPSPLAEQFRGLSLQMALENEWAPRERKGPVWLPGGVKA